LLCLLFENRKFVIPGRAQHRCERTRNPEMFKTAPDSGFAFG
jgi:hypothetical protein